jgi:hypothetical protein
VASNWKWLVSTLDIPLVGWIWATRRGKDKAIAGEKKSEGVASSPTDNDSTNERDG